MKIRFLHAALGLAIGIGGVVTSTAVTRYATRLAAPEKSPQMRLPVSEPRGSVSGIVGSYTGIQLRSDVYYGDIDLATGKVTKRFSGAYLSNGDDYDLQGSAVRDGILYISMLNRDYLTGITEISFNRADIAAGKELEPISFGSNPYAYAYSMAYDPKEDLFHLLCLDNNTGTLGTYSIVDPDDWSVTNYGLLSPDEFAGALCYNPIDEDIYVFTEGNKVMKILRDTHALVTVAELSDEYELVVKDRSTAITFSPLDNSFVCAWPDYEGGMMRLLFIDPDTFEVVEGEPVQPRNPYLAAIYCSDPYAAPEAPGYPEEVETSFSGASLSGTLTITAPTENFNGNETDYDELNATLSVDGKEVFSGAMSPGEKRGIDVTLEEGVHKAALVFEADGMSSPVRETKFHTGYDTPLSPAGISFDLAGNTLSWQNPGGTGANGGYVDSSDILYNVYIDGKLLTEEPIKETSLTLSADRDMSSSDVTVTALSHGYTSEAASINVIFGRSMELPVMFVPTAEDARLFRYVDGNNDGITFAYGLDEATGLYDFTLGLLTYFKGDDWLILPMLDFPDRDHLYEMQFEISNASPYESNESVEVFIGKGATPAEMDRKILSMQNSNWPEPAGMSFNFAVPEPGGYYIGIHCTSPMSSYGVSLTGIGVKPLADRKSSVPASPEVKFTPAPKGELKAFLEITAPVIDLVGDPLPAGEEVSFNVSCGGLLEIVSALPGQTVNVEMEVEENGYHVFTILPWNSTGEGLEISGVQYVGIDVPLAPGNVRHSMSEDNRSLTLSWDAPGETGENGGYVDVPALEYSVYTVNGVVFNEVARISETTYTYTPISAEQQQIVVSATARSVAGESSGSKFIIDNIGNPYPLPMSEEFGDSNFDYTPVFFDQSGEYSTSVWDSGSTVTSAVGKVDVDCVNGCLYVYTVSTEPAKGRLILPKMSTLHTTDAKMVLRWLDWAHAPEFSVWGRHYGKEEVVKIAGFEPKKPANAAWVDQVINLPEDFNNCAWVQLYVQVDFSSDSQEYGFIDSYKMIQDVDSDLKVGTVTGPAVATVGENAEFHVSVLNAGSGVMSGTLECRVVDAGGTLLFSSSDEIRRLQPSREYLKDLRVPVTAEYLKTGEATLEVEVKAENDDLPGNNTGSCRFSVRRPQAPVVEDLTASRGDDGNVTLTWSEPDLSYGGYDSFEMLPSFTITENLGMWKNYDLDGGIPFAFAQFRWKDDVKPQAWSVINAEELNVMNDERLAPHSGKQYLMARTNEFDENADEPEYLQADKWLVSPEIVGGTSISFWYGSISPSYKEYVELWCSTTDDYVDPTGDTSSRVNGSFRYVRTFSKEGSEGWEYVSYPLPANAKYFALVYRSYDSFGAMLDDIEFTPRKLEKWEIDHYELILTPDGEKSVVLADNLTDTSYVDGILGNRDGNYNVVAYVKTSGDAKSGPMSNTARIDMSGIDDIKVLSGVYGSKESIVINGHTGKTLAIYSADGKYVKGFKADSDSETVGCIPGVYIVKAGNSVAKVIVK